MSTAQTIGTFEARKRRTTAGRIRSADMSYCCNLRNYMYVQRDDDSRAKKKGLMEVRRQIAECKKRSERATSRIS